MDILKKYVFFIVFMILIVNILAAGNLKCDWTEGKIKNDPGISNGGIILYGEDFLLTGGITSQDYESYKNTGSENGNCLCRLEGDKWTPLNISGFDSDRISSGGALIKDRLWFFGSFSCRTKRMSKETWCVDLKSKKTENIDAEGEIPELRYGHSMTGIKVGDDLYFILLYGGMVDDFTANSKSKYLSGELYLLSSKCRHWEKVDFTGTSPGKRMGASFVTVGRNMYIIGGVGENGRYLNDVWNVNPFGTEEVFSRIKFEGDPVCAAYRASAVLKERYVFLIGGEAKINGKVKPISDIDVFDTYENKWYNLGTLPTGISMGSAVLKTTGGKRNTVSLYGGRYVDKYGNSKYNDSMISFSFDEGDFFKYIK